MSYDEAFDILYVRVPTEEATYGEENEDAVVTLRRLSDDVIVGGIIYDFKKRCLQGDLDPVVLPIPIDWNDPMLTALLEPLE